MCRYYLLIYFCVLLACALRQSVLVGTVASANTSVVSTFSDSNARETSFDTTTASVTKGISSTTDNASISSSGNSAQTIQNYTTVSPGTNTQLNVGTTDKNSGNTNTFSADNISTKNWNPTERTITPANTSKTTGNTTSSNNMITTKANTTNTVAATGADLGSGAIAAGVVLGGAFICIGFVYFAANIRMRRSLVKKRLVKKIESVNMRKTTNL
ncbi:hypothetical protein CHS0354_013313 [Potamilus streckersoni]|uniref:Uncharacterized protein n=1 Tax=Potamilus streckersoni TaxID=2493646 RepID=A0AAE0TI50_9BIVA|nr:hypothetical protein CHS0354_013313 [Potamilus streckersoni]